MSYFVKCFETCLMRSTKQPLRLPAVTIPDLNLHGQGSASRDGTGGARCSWRAVGAVARVSLQMGNFSS